MIHISNTNTLKQFPFFCFRSIMRYGVILVGNLPNSKRIFGLQKKMIRIMVGAKSNISS
jgi:hypothetical protein